MIRLELQPVLFLLLLLHHILLALRHADDHLSLRPEQNKNLISYTRNPVSLTHF